MIIINTMKDIHRIRREKQIDKFLGEELEEYFKELTQSFTGTNELDTFNLEEHGSIIILEDTDDPHDLEEIGYPKEHGGLFSAFPEFVNIIELEEASYYKIVIVCSNSYGIVVYSKVGQLGKGFEKWVSEYLED
ncbi:hypothetical protein [Tepidibacter mesophilus]|uniref:hypothetical protein n=1 Tax=Tepidibacter mesophilus TaxID=655607 RepID=UPI000C06A71D|nr:hypothetical protein [Tepidibacter mesophilus]